MRVGVLGELEVRDDEGREVLVAGTKLRALLVLLAFNAGRVVPTDQLIGALWGDEPPAGVRNSLQGLVSKLRRTLGPAELVTMRGGGYALEVPREAVDAHQYEALVARGRAAATEGDAALAASLLAEAEALWRGEPLTDLAHEEVALGPLVRLGELRLAVLEERFDLELQTGAHLGAIGPLEDLVALHPLRERLRALLMLALYRGGRQADALRAYQEGRRVLGEELGLDPGPELRQLEAAILAQDPSLDAPPPAPSPSTDVRGETRWTIPASLTPLIGRDRELRDLRALAAEQRFVTLVGPGGVGKTRLALEVARAESQDLAFGGCLVELAPVGDPAGVRSAIAAALDLPDPSRLAEVVADRELLIALDNCEHVITTAAEVAEDLLRRCPRLRVLATSREGLRVVGEVIWPVPPLDAADAATLFVERACAAGAPLDPLDGSTSEMVEELCARLDGLPLAIELAAARARVFPLAQIAARLEDRFRLLTGGARTALPRQQTLRAVVDWSYELLFEDEQRVFERLSVFPGGCDLPTVEAVLADDQLAADDLPDLLQALVDKSLVTTVPVAGGARYVQLQTLAHYGKEKLTERGDAVRVRDAMTRHFVSLCAESAAAYTGPRQRAWLTAIDREGDNLKAALDWAVANDDATSALTIAGGASWPHWLRGTIREGLRWLDDAFACGGEADERARALGLTGRGLLGFLVGDVARSDADLASAIEVFGRLGDRASLSLAHSFYAEAPAALGDVDEARRRRIVARDLYGERPDDPFAQAARTYSLGKLALYDGDLGEAERHYRAATEAFSRLDRPVMHSMCLGMVADFDERAGDLPAARAALEAAIETNQTLLGGFTGSLHARLGWVLLRDGQVARSGEAYRSALDSARRVRHPTVSPLALAGMAAVHLLQGRPDAARAAADEGRDLFRAGSPRRFRNRIDFDDDLRVAAAVCCQVLAAIDAEAGDRDAAELMVREAEDLLSGSDAGLPEVLQQRVARALAAAAPR